MLLAMAGFAISDGLIKAAGHVLASQQIILMIGVVGTVAFAVASFIKGENPFPASFFHPAVLVRNAGELLGTWGIVTSVSLIPLASVSAIQQANPLVVSLAAVFFFKETVGPRRWVAIIVGLLCVLLILRPGMDGFDPNALVAVGGMLGLSVRDLATRRVPKSITSLQLSTFGYAILIPLGLILTLPRGIAPMADGIEAWAYLIAISISGMTAYFTITVALRLGDISAVIPFRYSRLIFAIIIGLIFFGEIPDWQTLVGAAGIIASGLFLMIRDRKVKAV